MIIYSVNAYNSILWLKLAVFYEQTLYFTALKENVPENYLQLPRRYPREINTCLHIPQIRNLLPKTFLVRRLDKRKTKIRLEFSKVLQYMYLQQDYMHAYSNLKAAMFVFFQLKITCLIGMSMFFTGFFSQQQCVFFH